MATKNSLELFAICNHNGKFFRKRNIEGNISPSYDYDETWVDSLSMARIYPRSRPAKSMITILTHECTGFPPPKLVIIEARIKNIIDYKK